MELLVLVACGLALGGVAWGAGFLAKALEYRRGPLPGPRERVRVRPGYVVRVGADGVSLIRRPSVLLFPLAIGLLALATGAVAAALVTSGLIASKPGLLESRSALHFVHRVSGHWTYYLACGTLVPIGLVGWFASQHRVSLVLESRGPLRYVSESWPFPSTVWELDPTGFASLVVVPHGRVFLLPKASGEPRELFECSHVRHLDEDVALASLFLAVLADEEEPRCLTSESMRMLDQLDRATQGVAAQGESEPDYLS